MDEISVSQRMDELSEAVLELAKRITADNSVELLEKVRDDLESATKALMIYTEILKIMEEEN